MTVEELKKTEEFQNYGYTIVKCPICGEPTLDSFWICDNCNWEFDGAVLPEQYSSANHCTVAEYRKKYRASKNEGAEQPAAEDPVKDLETGFISATTYLVEDQNTGFTYGSSNVFPLVSMQIKKCSNTATIPTKAHETDACFDIYADLGSSAALSETVPPHGSFSFHTGFTTSIPKGYFAAVYARSGMGCKRGLRLANSTGIIDCDYRGEWMVVLRNDSDEPQVIHHGDRIAQFTILPCITTELIEVDNLDDTDRGAGGFGSSGV